MRSAETPVCAWNVMTEIPARRIPVPAALVPICLLADLARTMEIHAPMTIARVACVRIRASRYAPVAGPTVTAWAADVRIADPAGCAVTGNAAMRSAVAEVTRAVRWTAKGVWTTGR